MFCPGCGARPGDGDAFCQQCGRRLDSGGAPAAAPGASRGAAGAHRWSQAARSPFLFANAWWSRSQSGDVVRWDEGRQAWSPVPASHLPFFMARPKFTSLQAPAAWLYVLFGLFGVCMALLISADIWRLVLIDQILGGTIVDVDTLLASDDYYETTRALAVLSYFLIPGFFIWWTRRAYCNLASLGAGGADYSPGWAVGAWFVPFLALVRPFRILNHTWRGSDPDLPPDLTFDWRHGAGSALMITWWVVYMVVGVGWGATVDTRNEQPTVVDLQDATTFALVADFAFLAAGVLAVVVVFRLTRRQEEANRRFDLESGLMDIPGARAAFPDPDWSPVRPF